GLENSSATTTTGGSSATSRSSQQRWTSSPLTTRSRNGWVPRRSTRLRTSTYRGGVSSIGSHRERVMRIAWFTPLSVRSAIGEFSVHVTRALREHADVELWNSDT